MKKIFLLGLLILSVHTIYAQSCRDILNKAQASYQAGDLRLAMRQLQDAEICDYKNELQKERQKLQRVRLQFDVKL